MSHLIRTTMRPDVELEVDDAEYEILLTQGLIYDGSPPVEPVDPFDAYVADRLSDVGSLTRAAMEDIVTDPVIAGIVADADSDTAGALRAASVAAVEDADTVEPTGAWDFATAPTVAGAPINTGGSGAVDSVNGQTGVVVLGAADLADFGTASVAAVQDAAAFSPTGAWDFAQAPTVDGLPIGGGVSDDSVAALVDDTDSATHASLRETFEPRVRVTVDGHDQAALAAAVATLPLDGGVLYFPAGAPYVLSAGTTFDGYSNLTFDGDGALIIAADAMPDVVYNSFPDYGKDSLFRLMDCTNVRFTSGLTIDGNIANRTPYGPTESFNSNVLLSACENVTMESTLIGGMTDNITVMADATNTRLSKNIHINGVIKQGRRNNISLVGHDGVWIDAASISSAGRVKAIAPMSNIQCEPDYLGTSKNLHITNCDIFDAAGDYSVSISGKGTENATVEGNTIRDNAGNGLNVSSLLADPQNSGVIVRGNKIRDNGQAGMTHARGNAALIEGNLFQGNKYGFNSIIAGDVSLVGNIFQGNSHHGAVFTTFVSVRMAANRFEDNASAQGLTDGAGYAVFATPTDATSVFTFDGNTLSNTAGSANLMKGAEVTAVCNARGSGNTGRNLNDNTRLLRRIQGSGNWSIDAAARTNGVAGEANFDENLDGGGRLLIGSKYHYAATAAPTTGTWEKGDIVYNTAPAPGKAVRWVCLVNGTPGYWQADGIVPAYGGDMGDATVTVKAGVDNELVRFDTTLTANRDLGLSTVGAWDGAKFRVKRTGGGAFTLNVGGIKTLTQNQWVDVMFDGAAWHVTAFGNL